jgi:hypothetical protein
MRMIIFILLILLWAFGPSILVFTNLNCVITSLAWVLEYSYVWSAFSFVFNLTSVGIILHIPRFFFLLYVSQSLGKTIEFKKTISFGILAELPFILGAVYYSLFPPGVYSYTLTIPLPIILVVGILLLKMKPRN